MAFVRNPYRPSERRRQDLVRNSSYTVPLATKKSGYRSSLDSENGMRVLMTVLLSLTLIGSLTFGFVGLLHWRDEAVPNRPASRMIP